MSNEQRGYLLEHLPNEIHVYRFYDMDNETVDAWVNHRKEYRTSIPPDYLDKNILDLRACPPPTAYGLNAVTRLGQTANRSKYFYAIIGLPGFMVDMLRVTAAAVSRWRETEQNLQAFTDEPSAIEWLLKQAALIEKKK